jgi:serine protease AprX
MGALGLPSDISRLSLTDIPWYTTATGTSFSAPQVAATIAMMLEANPDLTPAQVKDILQRTATPMPEYYYHEVGAGMLNAHAAVLEAAFPDRRMGAWRATLDKKSVRFINDPPQQISGTVPRLGGVFEKTISIPPNAALASVQIAWGPILGTADLGLKLIDPAGRVYSVNTLNLPGLTGKRERLVINMPSAGVWRMRVNNSTPLSLTSQPFTGAVEVTRAETASLRDIGGLSATQQAEIYQTLRTRVMIAAASRFRPEFGVTRAALAEAMILGARIPQYLASGPRYADVRDLTTRNFVESAQLPANGALFPEDGSGFFQPREIVDRLTAAVVLVRAAGLEAEAEAQQGATLSISDGASIPAGLRGYVAVALARGLITAESASFRPQSALTRVELAHALVALQRMATE